LQAALKRYGIRYPVAQDNEYATWNAYRNQYWPAQYILDQRGKIVFEHAGEGQYDDMERVVRKLLDLTSRARGQERAAAIVAVVAVPADCCLVARTTYRYPSKR
jgi:hypothetical protein